jgi:hypothetical protein
VDLARNLHGSWPLPISHKHVRRGSGRSLTMAPGLVPELGTHATAIARTLGWILTPLEGWQGDGVGEAWVPYWLSRVVS